MLGHDVSQSDIVNYYAFLPGIYYLFQDSDYMSNDSKVAPERSQIGNYVTISSSAVDSRRYTSNLVKGSPTKKGKMPFSP